MKKTKIMSGILAAALALSMSVPAFAVTYTGTGKDPTVTLNGSVEQGATLISVVLPTSIDFQVATDADYHYAGITSGVGDVANNSKTGEGADVAVKISLVAVNDQNNLTNLMRLGLAPSNKESVALEQPYLLNGFNAENPQEIFSSLAGGATSDLTVFGGKASGAQNPNIPDGDYTIVTTVKVEAITTPAT